MIRLWTVALMLGPCVPRLRGDDPSRTPPSPSHSWCSPPTRGWSANGGRETEIFANVVSISGESELAARLVERLFPALFRQVMGILETIK